MEDKKIYIEFNDYNPEANFGSYEEELLNSLNEFRRKYTEYQNTKIEVLAKISEKQNIDLAVAVTNQGGIASFHTISKKEYTILTYEHFTYIVEGAYRKKPSNKTEYCYIKSCEQALH